MATKTGKANHDRKMKWWREARFGLFIHCSVSTWCPTWGRSKSRSRDSNASASAPSTSPRRRDWGSSSWGFSWCRSASHSYRDTAGVVHALSTGTFNLSQSGVMMLISWLTA